MRERTLRFGGLFAGAGGMSLGLHRAGMDCQFHAEIAAFPRKVLTYRFPDIPLLSDVRALSGGRKTAAWMRANYGGKIDLLAGGSPCQDLSVAGKRAGLAGARSSLFFRQVRLWRVLDAPYILWENVAGALSSNNGADFAAVLSAIVGATVTVPRDGWGGDESGGGVAAGPRAVAAWRLLDAQWFGVPQRRLRVFVLGARAGGCDPAEVLLEPESLYRNPPTRREARQGSADAAESGSGKPFAWNEEVVTSRANRSRVATDAASPSLTRGGRMAVAFDWQKGNDVTNSRPSTMNVSEEQTGTIAASRIPAVLAFDNRLQGEPSAVAPCVTGSHGNHGMVLGFHVVGDGSDYGADCSPTIRAQEHSYGGRPPAVLCTTGDVTHALTHEGHDVSEDGTGRGTPIIANTVTAREAKGWNPASTVGNGTVTHGIPRRLMPIECERLMSWPDNWTNVPGASDAARYKACGNGVVSNVAQWIGERLQAIHGAMRGTA